MIRLIASDLDGTLLLNGAQSLQPETTGLIQELTRQGQICGSQRQAVCQSVPFI